MPTEAATQPNLDYKVIVIGSGMSGICVGAKLKNAGIDSFAIFEKAGAVGGTWRDNTYPGVACDVPSHLYSFSFAPKSDWSRWYAPGAEICRYISDCAHKFDLIKHIRFNHRIVKIWFSRDHWNVQSDSNEVHTAQFVVAAMGGLHTPHIPDFKGMEDFSGALFHTANWNHDASLAGRRVAIIGTGASSVQAIPEIARIAKELVVFQRSAIWVLPKDDPLYTEEQKREFANSPLRARLHRNDIWRNWESFAVEVVRNTPRNRFLKEMITRNIQEIVGDTTLAGKLLPDYAYGCKRPTLSNSYYPAFNRSNVRLVTETIGGIEPTGIRTADGSLHCVDAIILATGFRPFDITANTKVTGLGGQDLGETWLKDGISAYHSVMVHNFPNFFVMLGPNSGGLTSALEMIEPQAKFVMRVLKYLAGKGATYLHPTKEATQEWLDLVARGLSDTLMNTGCRSWWTDSKGRNHTTWPYSSAKFKRMLSKPKEEHFLFA